MNALPLAFGAPVILIGLLALPVIWWLLRVTPPSPKSEVFPPLRILARVLNKEETPNKSPWWMTLLRLLLAGMVILALAEPVWNPRPGTITGNAPLAIVIDNGWASAESWEIRQETGARLIADAQSAGAPIYVIATAEKTNADIGPFDGGDALKRLEALDVRPIPVDRRASFDRLGSALSGISGLRIAYLSDGIETPEAAEAFRSLEGKEIAQLYWYQPDTSNLVGLRGVENRADSIAVFATRSTANSLPRSLVVGAFDSKGRRIGEAPLAFDAGSHTAEAAIQAPFELRNDFFTLRIDGSANAASTYLLDDNTKRRRVALISGSEADQAQPLLSSLYYISRALQPYADLIRPRTADLAQAIPELLDQKPSVVIMADIGKLPEEAEQLLSSWVEDGGTLIRFAGSRLAGASEDDTLLPVTLRRGERSLGGALSWTEPQPVAPFPAFGPFAGMPAPTDITVSRQVLAEPSPDLFEKSWANLADGTPLVTGMKRERGEIVLFHVTPEATWSNLPISGTFVDMLRRIVALSRAAGQAAADTNGAARTLPPYLMIAADGSLAAPGAEAKPLSVSGAAQSDVSFDNPPGFYGAEDALVALNLFKPNAELKPLLQPAMSFPVTASRYATDESVKLRGPLFTIAALLLALDTLALLWLGGYFRRSGRRLATTLLALAFLPALWSFEPSPALAQEPVIHDDSKPGDQAMVEAVTVTRLAYVITGNDSTDEISRAGLQGLSNFIAEKTALEPGEPAGINPETDELAFYPIIYWPIEPSAPLPSDAAIARIDAYMQQGGTVLFDTRDQDAASLSFDNSSTPANERLRTILSGLNVPPLEPVPSDHVLTKTFFIMNDFPGRFHGSPLWVAASLNDEGRSDRPVRAGDGVTPIMITGNDFASAWAMNSDRSPMAPTIPNDPMQRIYAFRAGINIVMYMLTGNYKSDQVHVPILLERLGN
ncbi:MAG: DUF4159 domain-containing protein [Phyllobacterium sp.]